MQLFEKEFLLEEKSATQEGERLVLGSVKTFSSAKGGQQKTLEACSKTAIVKSVNTLEGNPPNTQIAQISKATSWRSPVSLEVHVIQHNPVPRARSVKRMRFKKMKSQMEIESLYRIQ